MTYDERHKLVMPLYAHAVLYFRWSSTVYNIPLTRTHKIIKSGVRIKR